MRLPPERHAFGMCHAGRIRRPMFSTPLSVLAVPYRLLGGSGRISTLLALVSTALLLSLPQSNAADCNGNDIDDLDDIASSFSDDCNGDAIPDECDVNPLTFELEGSPLAVPRFPLAVATADFNRDGELDIVVGSQATDGTSILSVLLRDPVDAVFSSAVEYDAGTKLSALAVADLTDDGAADVVSVNETQLLLFENDGTGTFADGVAVIVGETAAAIVAGDLSGDGLPDLIVTHSAAGSVSVLENQGSGSFLAPQPHAVGEFPSSVLAADLNGDGDVDLAVGNRNSATVSVLLSQGDGNLASSVDYPAGVVRPFGIVASDFDGDGSIDLALGSGSAVAVLTNAGDGSFGAPSIVNYSGTASAIAVGDVDGDIDPDIVVSFLRSDQLMLVRNVTVSAGEPAAEFRGLVETQGNLLRSRAVAAGDIDGDGDCDAVVITNNSVELARNDGESTRSVSFASSAYQSTAKPHTGAIGDIDGDGDIDAITGNNTRVNGITVYVNRGDGTYPDRVGYTTEGSTISLALFDVESDGDLDIAALGGGGTAVTTRVEIMTNDGENRYAHAGGYTVSDKPIHVSTGDTTGDGFPEFFVSHSFVSSFSVFRNLQDGTFEGTSIDVGSSQSFSMTADVDRDGDLDVAISAGGGVELLINRGDGTFDPPRRYPVAGSPSGIAAGDLDGDGYIDLATANRGAGSVSMLRNLGQTGGDELFAPAVSASVDFAPASIAVGDMDRDGRAEMATANVGDNSASVLFVGAGQALERSLTFAVGNNPRHIFTGDVDLDGDLDLVTANWGSVDITVLSNQTPVVDADFLERICTEGDFVSISVPSSLGRFVKFVVPAKDDPSLIPPVFQNVRRFSLHEDFLAGAFPDRFPTRPQGDEYDELVGRRATRDYYVGALARRRTAEGIVYAFTVAADTGFDPAEVLQESEVEHVYQQLLTAFDLELLAYEPDTQLAKDQAATWQNPPFPIVSESAPQIDYEAYTLGIGFGRVRIFTLEEFEAANSSGLFTFQDIIVVDEAPRDVEGVVGGFITGAIQGPLSHVSVRTARRGTPNAFVADALEEFARFENRLVRLEVGPVTFFVDEADPQEAEDFWATNRPSLPRLAGIDATHGSFDHLFDMELEGAVNPVSRFGGKATNLARLQRVLTGELAEFQEQGFAIPMRYYVEFMATNRVDVGGRDLSYAEFLAEMLADETFKSDSATRFQRLEEFRELVRGEGVVDPALVAALVARIEEVFGSRQVMVRFRSSSNVEDALEFNGAGLYESTSVCAADTVDPATPDGSHCDPTRNSERTIERALKKVWSSLWTFRAHEERTFFQIPPEAATMGLLVNRAFLDEAANGVAFTGNPQNVRDRRYMITAQLGEESVVSPAAGISVERTFLEVSDGDVVRIVRDRRSSLVEPGEVVMSDDDLSTLGRLMWHIDQNFPLDLEGHAREQVLLDFEFKIEPDGSLAVKQVRPFLIPDTVPPSPDFELEVPAGTALCGVFTEDLDGREPRTEYETKSRVTLRSGVHPLPTGSSSFSADLIEEVVFGPEQLVATAVETGLFQVEAAAGTNGETVYSFSYTQGFQLPSGDAFEVRLSGFDLRGRGSTPVEKTLSFDEDFMTSQLSARGVLAGQPVTGYSSCTHSLLPRWEIDVDLGGGSRISLVERFLPSEVNLSSGPASLRRAEIELDGHSIVVTDYWRLVYSARRHNVDVRYWVVLETPINVTGVERPVKVVEVEAPDPVLPGEPPETAVVRYLDDNFVVMTTVMPTAFNKVRTAEAFFVRGDVEVNGMLQLGDALSLLGYLFRRGAAPECVKTADVDDDGRVTVSDGVKILLHLFAGGAAPVAPLSCGTDPTPDALSCQFYSGCD